jgi:RNA polymerase sigma-70 factor (ECF subfamily)
VHATIAGDVDALLGLLATDVVLVSDGGSKQRAARRPVEGADRVARFLTNVVHKIPVAPQMALQAVNGEPGLVLSFAGQPFLAMALEIDGGRIQAVRMVVNPDKLGHVTASVRR